MKKSIFSLLNTGIIVFVFAASSMQLKAQQNLNDLAQNPKIEILKLSPTVKGNAVQVLKIGDFQPGKPAVLVAANLPGNLPSTTDAAIWLSNYVAADISNYEAVNWYIIPCGNPDALSRYSNALKWDSPTNYTPVNNDNDELIDEDGPEDLNGDGMITQMLVKHPLGTYVKDTADSRLIRKADVSKGEKGMYKLYCEGIDNDGDGKFNEDPVGGVNIDRNFTYDFEAFVPENGKWPGHEAESFSLLKFMAEHPDIAMVTVLGDNNNLLFPPEADKKAGVQKIKVPSYYAEVLGIDANKMHPINELQKAIESQISDKARGKSILKSLMNTSSPKAYEAEDITYLNRLSKEYKSYLKAKGDSTSYEKAGSWQNGSFEKLAYFEYGVPTFSLDIWNLPASKDKKKTYKEKVLAFADSNQLDLFVDWEVIQHEQLGEIEVGGFKPYALSTPPASIADSLFELQLPFLVELSKKLPRIDFHIEKKALSDALFQVDVYLTNNGATSYPIAMGYRNSKPAPIVLKLVGEVELLSGKKRTPIDLLKANSTQKLSYVLNKQQTKSIEFQLESKNVLVETSTLKIEW